MFSKQKHRAVSGLTRVFGGRALFNGKGIIFFHAGHMLRVVCLCVYPDMISRFENMCVRDFELGDFSCVKVIGCSCTPCRKLRG